MMLSTLHQMLSRYRKTQHRKSNILRYIKRTLGEFIRVIYNSPNISLTPANVMTKIDTNKSAIANDAKNKFPILRKLRSVAIARHTRIFPVAARNIIVIRNVAAK
jgi:hypothetical protein